MTPGEVPCEGEHRVRFAVEPEVSVVERGGDALERTPRIARGRRGGDAGVRGPVDGFQVEMPLGDPPLEVREAGGDPALEVEKIGSPARPIGVGRGSEV